MDWVNATQVNLVDHGMYTLADPESKVEDLQWMVIVDCVILAFTLLGAGAILASMAWLEYKGRPSTVRTRLVQALVVSDLLLGIVGMIGTARRLAGYDIADGSKLCDGLGLLLVTVLFTEHLWTFTLAVATFLILIYPLHWSTIVLEKFWFFLWGIVWVIAFGIGVLGYKLVGYRENGGICYYGSNAGLYGELMQFIPRACVFIAISILYTRLFVFLRRPDKIRSPYSNSPTNGTYDSERGHRSYVIQRHRRRLSALFRSLKSGDTPKQGQNDGQEIGPKDMSGIDHAVPIPMVQVSADANETRRASDGKKWDGPGEIPPWERLDLPTFEVNGERFGGPATHAGSGSLWNDWKGLGSRTGDSSKKRSSLVPVPAVHTNSLPAAMPQAYGTRGSDQSGTSSSTFTSLPPVVGTFRGSDPVPLATIYSSDPQQDQDQDQDQDPLGRYDHRLPTLVSDHMTPSTSSTNLAEPSPSHPDFQSSPHIRRSSENDSSVSSSAAGKPITTFDDRESEHAREDEEWDLMRVLQSTLPEGDGKERNRSAASSEEYELVPESMSSYLNRKTSMLMLYFPLAYVLLFSVSLIRLIYDFISPNPSTPLRAISRWFVFSQGIVDALIYGLVEWHTKRVVRRKVRKGHFSPSQSRNTNGSNAGQAFSNAIRSLGSGGVRSKPNHGAGLNPSSRGHNVSFQDGNPTRSILAELDFTGTGGDGSRKSSKVESEER